jgi:hypothetical protein
MIFSKNVMLQNNYEIAKSEVIEVAEKLIFLNSTVGNWRRNFNPNPIPRRVYI